MKLYSPYLERGARMELTPLMDVMFLVLVFFVYTVFSMAVHRGVKVELAHGSGTLEKGERIEITLDAADRLQLNGRALPQSALVGEVGRLVAVSPDMPVLISGDRNASLGVGVSLLEELKKAGAAKISFQVDGSGQCGGSR